MQLQICEREIDAGVFIEKLNGIDGSLCCKTNKQICFLFLLACIVYSF